MKRNATQEVMPQRTRADAKNKNKKAASKVSGFNIAIDLLQGLRMNLFD